MSASEANFDGLVGPTHNYSGLAFGNVAALAHAGAVSNPREAALQGLNKMRTLHALGIAQGVLPPQERPAVNVLRRLWFHGSDARVLASAARQAPDLLALCASASSMWTANAATVSPSADASDGKIHFTPANLCSQLHRAIEAPTTARALRALFPERRHFRHHTALPAVASLGDEGAANHTRLSAGPGRPGVELFVYGRSGAGGPAPRRYPARQTLEASQAVARLHRLAPERMVFAQQHPDAIDAGVFHNDVISVGHDNVFLYHERAFTDTGGVEQALRAGLGDTPLSLLRVAEEQVSVADAVRSYLFNSQLVTPPQGGMHLIVPRECEETPAVRDFLARLVAEDTPIRAVTALDLHQSMHNGGGPACLRLRVELTEAQRAAVNPAAWFDEDLHVRLSAWVRRHYRDRLAPADLADPALLDEGRTALDELTGLLNLGSIYPFQRTGHETEDNDEY